MTADKRTVTTDALETLGSIIGPNEKRDAIHLAVEPVEAAHELIPGDHVGLINGKASAHATPLVGIVDPFLAEVVKTGQRFWLVVYPRQISSLRHVWEHPSFPPSGETGDALLISSTAEAASELWLRRFCEQADCPDYETVIAAASGEPPPSAGPFYGNEPQWEISNYGDSDEYLLFRGLDAHGKIPPEFWDHVEIVTGKKITHRATHFSCTC